MFLQLRTAQNNTNDTVADAERRCEAKPKQPHFLIFKAKCHPEPALGGRRVSSFDFNTGLTLVELLVGLAIISLIMIFAYEGIGIGLKIKEFAGRYLESSDTARAGLDMMASNLRSVFVSQFFHDPEKSFLTTTFVGSPDRMYFYTKGAGKSFSISEVEYFVEDGLKRRF
ncbi:MAG: prepilin-type N-terminal cleavage/methylation domain-containing protein, partial [Elusimicrobiota bacterium]